MGDDLGEDISFFRSYLLSGAGEDELAAELTLSEPGSTSLDVFLPLLAPRVFRISHQGVSCPELQGKSK